MDKYHLVATVTAQRMLFSQVERAYWNTGLIPEERQGKFVLGYIWGFLDASAQRVGLSVDSEDFIGAITYTYEKLLGNDVGQEKMLEGYELQQSEDDEYFTGMALGGEEVVNWVQSGAEMRMVSDSSGQSAADGKVVVAGRIPKGLFEHLVAPTNYNPQNHSCRFCEISEEELKNELAKVLPNFLRLVSDVASLEGMGVSIMHPEIPILPIACVERDTRPDGLNPPMPDCCLFVRFPLMGNLMNRPYQRPANLEDCRRQVIAFMEGKLAGEKGREGNDHSSTSKAPVKSASSGCLVFGVVAIFGMGVGVFELASNWI